MLLSGLVYFGPGLVWWVGGSPLWSGMFVINTLDIYFGYFFLSLVTTKTRPIINQYIYFYDMKNEWKRRLVFYFDGLSHMYINETKTFFPPSFFYLFLDKYVFLIISPFRFECCYSIPWIFMKICTRFLPLIHSFQECGYYYA